MGRFLGGNETLKPGDRVRLLTDVCRGAAKGALGTVAEVLDGIHGPRYGVKLDCNAANGIVSGSCD